MRSFYSNRPLKDQQGHSKTTPFPFLCRQYFQTGCPPAGKNRLPECYGQPLGSHFFSQPRTILGYGYQLHFHRPRNSLLEQRVPDRGLSVIFGSTDRTDVHKLFSTHKSSPPFDTSMGFQERINFRSAKQFLQKKESTGLRSTTRI